MTSTQIYLRDRDIGRKLDEIGHLECQLNAARTELQVQDERIAERDEQLDRADDRHQTDTRLLHHMYDQEAKLLDEVTRQKEEIETLIRKNVELTNALGTAQQQEYKDLETFKSVGKVMEEQVKVKVKRIRDHYEVLNRCGAKSPSTSDGFPTPATSPSPGSNNDK